MFEGVELFLHWRTSNVLLLVIVNILVDYSIRILEHSASMFEKVTAASTSSVTYPLGNGQGETFPLTEGHCLWILPCIARVDLPQGSIGLHPASQCSRRRFVCVSFYLSYQTNENWTPHTLKYIVSSNTHMHFVRRQNIKTTKHKDTHLVTMATLDTTDCEPGYHRLNSQCVRTERGRTVFHSLRQAHILIGKYHPHLAGGQHII